MGLGLAMVKKIVETYGGDINFIENINEGTHLYRKNTTRINSVFCKFVLCSN